MDDFYLVRFDKAVTELYEFFMVFKDDHMTEFDVSELPNDLKSYYIGYAGEKVLIIAVPAAALVMILLKYRLDHNNDNAMITWNTTQFYIIDVYDKSMDTYEIKDVTDYHLEVFSKVCNSD